MKKTHIDLNSDMGEGFGPWKMGDDEGILDIVSSANVACGFHAGDPEIMARVFAEAGKRGVAVGAHPGYADLWGFGRRAVPMGTGEIERLVAYQVGAAMAMSAYAGNPISYVKVHGALGNLSHVDDGVAKAIAVAIKAVEPSLICVTYAGARMHRIAQDLGLQTKGEVFADRAYTEEGLLVDRKLPGAVLHDTEAACARLLRMVQAGGVETLSGRILNVEIDTICLHSDTPGAVRMAAGIKRALEDAGITIKPFSRA